MAKIIEVLPEVRGEEMLYIQGILKDMTDEKAKLFASVYRSRRREPQLLLVLTLLGFVGFAGLHRMLTNQIGMGILYFFTVGLCFIGTILDLVNSEKLAFEYNRAMADETLIMIA